MSVGRSRISDNAAPFCWLNSPLTAIQICVESTVTLPPIKIGLPKSASDSTNIRRNEAAMPGVKQGQRNRAKDVPFAGAQAQCGFFHRRINPFEQAANDEIGDGKESDDLDKDKTIQSVNVVHPGLELDMQNILGDKP